LLKADAFYKEHYSARLKMPHKKMAKPMKKIKTKMPHKKMAKPMKKIKTRDAM
jgi:uncharacterized protein YcnI